MKQALKIAIIGEYNFTYYSHQATNLSLDHAALFLDVQINYYWLKASEFSAMSATKMKQFDGIWIAPGIPANIFYMNGIIQSLKQQKIPTLLTGESFKTFIELFVASETINPEKMKVISDNLVIGDLFEKLQIIPHSTTFIQLFEYHLGHELTSSRYSIYPNFIAELTNHFIDIEAYNQYEDPEIVSLKEHPFFVACGYTPQVTSTREMPHPLIYTFIKVCMAMCQQEEIEKSSLN